MKDCDYWIYKITSPSGRVYIGQTSNLTQRFKDYKYKDCKKQQKIYNSLCKYGPENHKFKIVCGIYDEPIENVAKIEQKVLDIHKNAGISMLNIRDAGCRGKHSEESKLKMSLAQKDRKQTPEQVEKNRLGQLGKKLSEEHKKNISKGNIGRVFSQETKNKISKGNKGKGGFKDKALKIVQYKDNIEINEFTSIRDVTRKLKISYKTIKKNCDGLKENIRGYVFKYKNPL